MRNANEVNLSLEDHQVAFTEISFLLDIFNHTIGDLMGGATATVGRIVGRKMANKLPLFFNNPTIEDVLSELSQYYKDGCNFTFKAVDDGAILEFKECAIRRICMTRNQELGGEICKMFHYSLAGIVNRIMNSPVKSVIEESRSTCRTRLVLL